MAKITPQMITDAFLRCFKLNLERSRAFQEALATAATEEQKRTLCEQFKNDAKTAYLCQKK